MAAQAFTGGVAQELTPNAFTRFGYVFAGWAESAGGEVAYADGQRVAVSSDRTLYALWEEVMAGRPDMSFSKAQTVTGALYDKDDRPVGTVQVKVGKMGKNGDVKLSASATLLADGKTQKVTAKAATMQTGSAGATLVFKAPIG